MTRFISRGPGVLHTYIGGYFTPPIQGHFITLASAIFHAPGSSVPHNSGSRGSSYFMLPRYFTPQFSGILRSQLPTFFIHRASWILYTLGSSDYLYIGLQGYFIPLGYFIPRLPRYFIPWAPGILLTPELRGYFINPELKEYICDICTL